MQWVLPRGRLHNGFFSSITTARAFFVIQASVPGQDERVLPVSSSTPPQFPPEQEALFREVLLCLNRANVSYAVSGAFALQQHTGIWRDTKDLDLFLPAEAVPR